MFNIFKKKELIRRPILTKFFFRICKKEEIEKALGEIENDINKFISGKETVQTNHSITFLKDSENSYSLFFQIDYVDDSTFFQNLSKKNYNIFELTKNDKKGKNWIHI